MWLPQVLYGPESKDEAEWWVAVWTLHGTSYVTVVYVERWRDLHTEHVGYTPKTCVTGKGGVYNHIYTRCANSPLGGFDSYEL